MSPQEAVSTESEPKRAETRFFRPSWQIAALLLVLTFFGAIRWRLADMPIERDEGEYAYAGQLMLHGIPPYKFAYNMKLPGTYAAYAVMMGALGQSPQSIHLGLILVSAATIIFIYLLGTRLFGESTGIVAAATYALLTAEPTTLGLAAHATHFVVLCAVPGLIALLSAEERNRVWLFGASGFLFGLAFLMKQPGAVFGVFALLYLVSAYWRLPGTSWQSIVKRAAVFLLGCALPFLLTCLILWRAGVFSSFWLWTFSYARQYSSLVSLKDGWDLFTFHFGPMFLDAPGVWIIALVGLATFLWQPLVRRHWLFVIGLLVFSFAGVSSGLYFRGHYFIMVLPAIALLTGIAVDSATSAFRTRTALRVLPVIVFVIALGWAIIDNARLYFVQSPIEACRSVYVNSPFVEAIAISDYLRQNTSPTDRIAILGSEPEIYFYSHRLSATGYIYMYPLMENQPYWQQMQKQMIDEVESGRPAYVVYFNHPASWLTTMGSSRLGPFLNWANVYLKSNYEKIGMVDLTQPNSQFVWGDAVKNFKPIAEWQIVIFRRKG